MSTSTQVQTGVRIRPATREDVPVILQLSFSANDSPANRAAAERVIGHGYGLATIRYVEFQPDSRDGLASGVRALAPGHVLVWEDGVVTPVDSPANSYSLATGINERGQIVGWSRSGSGPPHAVLWEQGGMTDLGALADAEQSSALAISNSGRVTGWSRSASGELRALVWSKSGSPNAAMVVATR